MRFNRLVTLYLSFFALASCAVTIPNLEGCSGVNGFAGVGALCQNTLSDHHRDLTVEQWLDFLYARPDDESTKDVDEAKGPAVCFSSVDMQKQKTAMEQLCVKAKCTYEQKKVIRELLGRMESLQTLATMRSTSDDETRGD